MIQRFIIFLAIGATCWPALTAAEARSLPIQLNGQALNPLEPTNARAIVLVFLATDCPISNRYAPLVNRIYTNYKDKGIEFFAVYPMGMETVEGIKAHRQSFGYQLPALVDRDHFLVRSAEAMVTPEASVYVPDDSGQGAWIYRGRIDDLYLDFGKWRHKPSNNDLTDVLDAILAGKTPEPRRTRAIGCYISE